MTVTTIENERPVAAAPTEPAGRTVDAPAVTPPAAAAPAPAAPSSPSEPSDAETSQPDQMRRVVGLPTRPRLRVSYWFEGDDLKCEAVLMSERRELVTRGPIETDPNDPTLGQIFSFFAGKLVASLRGTGAIVVHHAAQVQPEPASPDEIPTKRDPPSRPENEGNNGP